MNRYFLAAVFALAVAGCSIKTTGSYKYAYYVNNSGIAVKVTAIARDSIDEPNYSYIRRIRYEREIENGDMWSNRWNPVFSDQGCYGCDYIAYPWGRAKPLYFKIEFLREPKVCLVFDGDDKVENDIRYWENYTLVSTEIEEMSDHTNYYHHYHYYITPTLMQQAKEEHCGE